MDGTVSFHERPEGYDNTPFLTHLDSRIQGVIDLTNKVRHGIDNISIDPIYVKRTSERGAKSFGEGPMEDFGEGADVKMMSQV
jgi:hypothetical protein